MPKTRRHKMNRSPRSIFPNSNARVVEDGFRVKVAGHRTAEGSKMIPSKDAKPVFVGRQYTGVPRGKTYPYSSGKRSGDPYKVMAATIRKTVTT